MKSALFLIITLLVIITNNMMFTMHEYTLVHVLQICIGVVLLVLFTWSMTLLSSNYLPKKYEMGFLFGFIFAARSTESILRKYLVAYHAAFYEAYKLYLFAGAVVLLLLGLYYMRQIVKSKKASKAA